MLKKLLTFGLFCVTSYAASSYDGDPEPTTSSLLPSDGGHYIRIEDVSDEDNSVAFDEQAIKKELHARYSLWEKSTTSFRRVCEHGLIQFSFKLLELQKNSPEHQKKLLEQALQSCIKTPLFQLSDNTLSSKVAIDEDNNFIIADIHPHTKSQFQTLFKELPWVAKIITHARIMHEDDISILAELPNCYSLELFRKYEPDEDICCDSINQYPNISNISLTHKNDLVSVQKILRNCRHIEYIHCEYTCHKSNKEIIEGILPDITQAMHNNDKIKEVSIGPYYLFKTALKTVPPHKDCLVKTHITDKALVLTKLNLEGLSYENSIFRKWITGCRAENYRKLKYYGTLTFLGAVLATLHFAPSHS